MGRRLRNPIAVSVLLGLVVSGVALDITAKAASPPTDSTLKIIVLIYNYAGAKRRTVLRASKAATTVFRRIGIETVWLDCTVPNAKVADDPSCPERLGGTHLVLRILSRPGAERIGLPPDCFGVAVLGPEDRFGYIANVFNHRVNELAKSRGVEEHPIILGHVLAHEIGHLLLGRNSHSDTGIMQAPWGREKLDRARFNNLRFTAREAERIRRNVFERQAVD